MLSQTDEFKEKGREDRASNLAGWIAIKAGDEMGTFAILQSWLIAVGVYAALT